LGHGPYKPRAEPGWLAEESIREGQLDSNANSNCGAPLLHRQLLPGRQPGGLRPLRVHLDAIERYMGHSSIAATMDVYGHLFPSDAEDLASKRRHVARFSDGQNVG
jgi:hypothetical protein